MSSKPLVSGIIIFLNAQKFIEEAIGSVFAQTYENWELLLVDDGSTDESTEIAQGYAEKYPEKLRYLDRENYENWGISAARNLGIGNAKGEYIAFLDADDIWLPNKLEQQLAILEAQPEATMLYGSTTLWYSWTGNSEDSQRDRIPDLGIQLDIMFKSPISLNLLVKRKATALCTCNALVRTEALEKVSEFDGRFQKTYEDRAFCTKILLEEPVVADRYWHEYQQHPASCYSTTKSTGQSDLARLVFLNWLEEYLSPQRVKDTEVGKLLKRELLPNRHPRLYRVLEKFWYRQRKMKRLVKRLRQRTLPVQVRHWLRVQKSRR